MRMQPITVSQLTAYIKSLLENAQPLQNLCLRGELSNYKKHQSGHHYFTLKDENAVINCVMFASSASKLRFSPESGMKVILYGRVSLFPKSGQYQVYVSEMVPDGVGALYLAFEQLKAKLFKEGLFDKDLKKPLPAYPARVALVTSPTGAAVRDMLRILGKRFPYSKVMVCPVKVQGEGAAAEIAEMLRYLDENSLADLIITGRGGGSLEDLWAFNEEQLARAIAACSIPVISAVGHEPDITISDYVADLRAATPSNAAELAVPEQDQLKAGLAQAYSRMVYAEKQMIAAQTERLKTLAGKKILQSPGEYYNEQRLTLSFLRERLASAQKEELASKRKAFVAEAAKLDAMSPLKVLARGYGFVTKNDEIIKDAAVLTAGDLIRLRLQNGSAECTVNHVECDR